MEHLECPICSVWTIRRDWFESQFDVDSKGGGYLMSEQATGLLVDLQAIYCCGAFVGSIILACTIVDTHLRDVELGPDFDGGIKAAFETSRFSSELDWLRIRRNRLIHFKESAGLQISVDMQYQDRETLERDAQRAILLVSSVLFEEPWV